MPANKPATKPSVRGKEIVDPEMAVFIKLDDLQRVLKKELTAQREVLVQILNTTILNQQHLKALVVKRDKYEDTVTELAQIKKELLDRRDEGDYYPEKGTATTTEHILDLNELFLHPVKQLVIKNDSKTTTIRIAFISRLDLTLGRFAEERYFDVNPREEYITPNNINVIWRIGIKTDSGTANYRLWLHW
jgi:hypothetical protein